MSKALRSLWAIALVFAAGCDQAGTGSEEVVTTQAALEAAVNPHGSAETVHTAGAIDRTNPFFQMLGINQRTCETCHSSSQGWTITAKGTAQLFAASSGLAPLFMLQDAGSRPDADISTLAARKATFKPTLVKNGLIRFNRTVPATGEFTVTAVADPSGFGTPALFTAFRRPTPTANESKVVSVTWTGGPLDVPTQVGNTSSGASRLHEQRPAAPPADIIAAMRDFQMGVIFAQLVDNDAGRLDADGATGGPTNLLAQNFYIGINDIQGNDPVTHLPFNRKVFNLFDAWATYDGQHHHHGDDGCDDDGEAGFEDDIHSPTIVSRAAIYRGQEIFNSVEFNISGVHGLNDVLGQTTVRGTCSTCHNTPNVGGHSVFRMFDVGTTDPANCNPDLPLLTLQNKTTLEIRQTCDMGRGGNGVWADVGAFRAPPLRGLAARAPYFHDGQANNIRQVIKYFDNRFSIGLSHHQKRDLEAFLGAL